MKYEYKKRTVYIDYECEKDLNDLTKGGWRFISFVPNSNWKSEDREFAIAIFERKKPTKIEWPG